jgi:hypothetical protein
MEGQARGRRLPPPDWDRVERFDPLPHEPPPFDWRVLEHGLNSTDLLVDVKLGGVNAQGRVEWIVPASTMVRFPDKNHVRIRWEMSQETMSRYELTDPRLRITLWRH